MAIPTLILLGRALESLQVDCVTTFGASAPVIVCIIGIKLLLLLHLQFVTVTTLVLVVSLFGFPEWSFLLAFTSWQLCVLVPQLVDLYSLWIPCHLFYMACGGLTLSNFLASCHTLLSGNFSRLTLPSLMALETNSSSFRKKKQKMSL